VNVRHSKGAASGREKAIIPDRENDFIKVEMMASEIDEARRCVREYQGKRWDQRKNNVRKRDDIRDRDNIRDQDNSLSLSFSYSSSSLLLANHIPPSRLLTNSTLLPSSHC
jgi:hypothetical protein